MRILTLKRLSSGKVVERGSGGGVRLVFGVWKRDGVRVAVIGGCCWDGDAESKRSAEGGARTAAEDTVAAAVRSMVCIFNLIGRHSMKGP